MASWNKFNCFVGDVGLKLHNLNTDEIKIYLTNTAPVAGNTVYNTPVDLSTGGGYTAGGQDVLMSYSQTGGTGTATVTDVVWTATTGFGPFRYAVVYNNTEATKPLIGWIDYGSSISLGAGETFTVDFGANLFTIV
jgi:hypothetical protein